MTFPERELSENFIQCAQIMLMEDEGTRPQPYDDATGKTIRAPVGKVSIGVGRNLDANPLEAEVILLMLKIDIQKHWRHVEEIFGRTTVASWTPCRQLAVLNMVFNLGKDGFLKFHATIAAIRAGNWHKAANQARESAWYKQVGKRAERVLALMRNEDLYGFQG